MLKLFFKLSVLLFLANCAAPGTALLTPAITGAKTKSVHQASLSLASSLSSNQFIRDHDKDLKKIKDNMFKKSKAIFNNFHIN